MQTCVGVLLHPVHKLAIVSSLLLLLIEQGMFSSRRAEHCLGEWFGQLS